MKKYIQPSMVVVRLQHHSIICSSIRGFSDGDVDYGGASSNSDGEVRTRESSSVWDNEW